MLFMKTGRARCPRSGSKVLRAHCLANGRIIQLIQKQVNFVAQCRHVAVPSLCPQSFGWGQLAPIPHLLPSNDFSQRINPRLGADIRCSFAPPTRHPTLHRLYPDATMPHSFVFPSQRCCGIHHKITPTSLLVGRLLSNHGLRLIRPPRRIF